MAKASFVTGFLTAIKILAGLAFLYIVVRGIRWETLLSGLRMLNPAWLLLSILSVLTSLFVKLWRWAFLIRNYQLNASNTRLFSAYFIGQAANILLPMRSGDIIRIGYLSGEVGIIPQVTTTVVLEKYLDLVALVICAVVVSINLAVKNVVNLPGSYIALILVTSILLFIFAVFSGKLWGIIRSRIKLQAKVTDWIDRWVEGSQWLVNSRKIYAVVLLTGLVWLIMWLTNILVFKSAGIRLHAAAAGMVLVSVYIGLIPAIMPGNIGPFYFFAFVPLIPFGVNRDQALLFAVVLHAIVTVPPLVFGSVGLFLRSQRTVSE